MHRNTKITAKYTQNLWLALVLPFILTAFPVKADTSQTTTPDIKYQPWYYSHKGKIYHSFLPSPKPQELSYRTRMSATANIDDTPEKETIALVLVDVLPKKDVYPIGNWIQAFLLIANTPQPGKIQKKAFFKLYDTGTYALEVPAAKTLELQSPTFVFTQPAKNALKSRDVSFTLLDLTGDGTLDIWFESTYGVAVISFQNGEFKEVFSSYTVPGPLSEAEYVDMDNDATYEIKIPYNIHIADIPGAPHLEWMSLYEWDGTTYVLNNERFYAENDEFLIQLLGAYNYQLLRHGSIIYHCETYRFYLGLVYHYQGSVSPENLQWIIRHGKNKNYIQAAEDISFHSGLIDYDRGELKRAQLYLQYLATEATNQKYRKDADAVLTQIWNKTDDRETFEWEYRSHLVSHFGDMPEVRTFLAGKKKLMSGNFRFPDDEAQFLRFYEAKYDLWPNKTVRRELEKVRKAKADGTPFNLIDWSTDAE